MEAAACPPALVVPRALREQMRAHVEACLPEEACGILGGRGGRAERALAVENELHSPTRYRMRAQAQVDAFLRLAGEGLELCAIYHSHPRGPAGLSPTDLAEALYPAAVLLVWSPDGEQAGGWRLDGFCARDGRAAAVELRDE